MEIADYIVADDRQLTRQVLDGDTTAFEYLFDRYRDAIHRLFLQRTGSAEMPTTCCRRPSSKST